MSARLYRDYINSYGKPARDEVDRQPEVITTRLRQADLAVGAIYRFTPAGEDSAGHWRLIAHEAGVQSTLEEACPAPGCHAPVTHRSLHDIQPGKSKESTP